MDGTPRGRCAGLLDRSLPPPAPLLAADPPLRPRQGYHRVRQVLVAKRARLVLPVAARVEAEEPHRVVGAVLPVVPPDAGLDVPDERHQVNGIVLRVFFL